MEFDEKRFQIIDHPLVQHKLHILRDKNTSTKDFRELVTELAVFEGYEAMRDLPLEDVEVETPLEKTTCKQIAGKKIAIIPILRAGLGMVDGILTLVPSARVGHVGMYRDPQTHEPHQYYCKFPPAIEDRTCLIVDPMLATGGSLTALHPAGTRRRRRPHLRHEVGRRHQSASASRLAPARHKTRARRTVRQRCARSSRPAFFPARRPFGPMRDRRARCAYT